MKVLYIGQNTEGTTSAMRAGILKNILENSTFHIIDTNVPFYKASRISRSLAFRLKGGPLVKDLNKFVREQMTTYGTYKYDLAWIDKGVFISGKTLSNIRKNSQLLVHFTPDMAFHKNRSLKFERHIDLYDYIITTKSSELEYYEKITKKNKIIFTTQGFSKEIHYSRNDFEQKNDSVVFIGLAEQSRKTLIKNLIDAGIHVTLGGMGWTGFHKHNNSNEFLNFVGEGVYSDQYAKIISQSGFGLGLLSKKFPEFHTTRTFEIPACKTALLTEKNKETSKFFNESNAIFFSDEHELLTRIKYFKSNKDELKTLSAEGCKNVHYRRLDYFSILKDILETIFYKNF